MTEKVIFTVEEARQYLARRGLILGKNTFYRLVNDGTIRSTAYGRRKWVSKRVLDRLLDAEEAG